MDTDKTSMKFRLFHLCASVFICGCFLGCEAQKNARIVEGAVQSYYSGDYAAAEKALQPLAQKPNEDFVVNNLRLGIVQLPPYQLDDSEASFLRAIEVINATGVNNGGRTLGAVLVDEKVKVWKGEPFERAMASFYLGVIHYIRHDYQNARASFENALFKLRDYDPKQPSDSKDVDSNFAPATLMLAKCFQRVGRDDLAQANFKSLVEHFPHMAALADEQRNLDSNVLLIVDYGHGPRKVTDESGSLVGFGPRPQQEGPVPTPTVRIDGTIAIGQGIVQPPADLLALAQERQWQSIDTIRAVKSTVGTGLLIGGAIVGSQGLNSSGARQRTDLMVAGGLLAGGLIMKATSQADIRQWEMLPRTTFIIPLHVAPGTHNLNVQFPGGLQQTWRNIVVPEKGEATYYLRMQRWAQGPFDWPPPAMKDAQ